MSKALLFVVMFCGASAASTTTGSAVQKVIELLEENKVKITNDLAAEEKEMAEYTDFCDKESSEKGYAIETAARKIGDLKATITDCDSKMPVYEDQISTLGSDVADKEKQLYEATEVRKKEKADFKAAEGELVTSIDQLTRAVTILKRETGASFAQMSNGKSQGLELALSTINRIIDSGRLAVGAADAASFLQAGDDQPQAKEVAYESKSGGIIQKIEEMKEKAEETLAGARSTETKAMNDFAMLEQSLNNGITVANDKISVAKKATGATAEQKGEAQGDLGETEASKAADEKYLQELKHDCSEAASNWAERQASATAEMGAIDKAIQILSEGVRVLLQTKQSTKRRLGKNNLEQYDSEMDDESQVADSAPSTNTDSVMRSRLVQKLKDMSRKFNSYVLLEVAGSAASDPFVKIRGLIEEMIAKLLKEAEEEATQKAFCDEEMGKSKKAITQKTNTLNKLQSRLDQAGARKAELEQAVKDLEAEVADLDKATAEATKIRNEENASYQKASKDFGDAAAATEKAIKVLKDFYDNAFLIQTGVTRSTMSARAKQPELGEAKSDAGSTIISILEMSNEDFTKLHAETETNEEEAVEAFEKLMNDNKASKAAKEAEVKASLSEIKSLTVSLENSGEDHSMVSKELDAVNEYVEKLKPQCEEKVMSYAEKKARREAEIAGLKEALEILAGGVFLQVKEHTQLRRGLRMA